MQIAPSHKHTIGIFEAKKINFAKHNEAHNNLPHAYKKTGITTKTPSQTRLPVERDQTEDATLRCLKNFGSKDSVE